MKYSAPILIPVEAETYDVLLFGYEPGVAIMAILLGRIGRESKGKKWWAAIAEEGSLFADLSKKETGFTRQRDAIKHMTRALGTLPT